MMAAWATSVTAGHRYLRGTNVHAGVAVPVGLSPERIGLSWPDQVLSFGLARFSPNRWTLEESSREVRLPTST